MKIWQKAIDLSLQVYQATSSFPAEEKFGLTSQIRCSAVSIPSNIAEGAGRGSNKEFVQFLKITTGSCYELKTQLIIGHKLGFLDALGFEGLNENINEIEKMVYGFIEKLKQAI